ncbi:MAG: VCBS repeat-containing protein [Planctomycetaceae bacterium]
MIFLSGCGKTDSGISEKSQSKKTSDGPSEKNNTEVELEKIRPQIVAFCGACHAVPKPETFPKSAWYDEVAQGYRFYDLSKRTDLVAPPMNKVVAYYRHLAPDKMPVPKPVETMESPPIRFSRHGYPFSGASAEPITAVSHIRWHSGPSKDPILLFTDMRTGEVRSAIFREGKIQSRVLAQLSHPAHVEPVDFNGDGLEDYLVAELGSFQPEDHDRGQVVLLQAAKMEPNGKIGYQKIVLKSQLGRVADVQSGDFDNDGDLDLVIAEFGWRTTGRILFLRQTGIQNEIPQFETVVLDKRHGTIHVPIVDLNKDGHLDFVALVSQEHEAVDAFLNRGDGTFERKRIYAADDPSFGSSGIQMIDLDKDGDLDVLYTNGDSLDSYFLKPYHSIRWLENRGTYPFTEHVLTQLPGVSRALAADMDGDGDLDIVASAYLPLKVANTVPGQKISTLIWLEQRKNRQFVKHEIERESPGGLAMDLGDFDNDGDTDIAFGTFDNTKGKDWLTIWTNNKPSPPSKP